MASRRRPAPALVTDLPRSRAEGMFPFERLCLSRDAYGPWWRAKCSSMRATTSAPSVGSLQHSNIVKTVLHIVRATIHMIILTGSIAQDRQRLKRQNDVVPNKYTCNSQGSTGPQELQWHSSLRGVACQGKFSLAPTVEAKTKLNDIMEWIILKWI